MGIMKIIVVGSTGFVASEIIRQALSRQDVTSIYALGRREISPPPNLGPHADESKLNSVILKDFEYYPDDVKGKLAGADAVIWTIAIGPSKLKTVSWEEACKISRDYVLKGIDVMSKLPRDGKDRSLRFIYMSGSNAERDQTKKPLLLGDYCLMRGDAENKILEFAKQSNGAVEACVARAGLIEDPNSHTPILTQVGRLFIRTVGGVPRITVAQISAALLEHSIKGFQQESLTNEDMVRIGTGVLTGQQ